jgi:hypothetical protein
MVRAKLDLRQLFAKVGPLDVRTSLQRNCIFVQPVR